MARPHQSHLEKLRRLPLRPSLRFRCGLRVRSSSRFFALATPVGQGVTAAVAAERLAGFLRPIKSGPSQGRHRPLGTAHPHAMANARQAVRPVISRSTPVRDQPYGEVEPGAGGDTEPAGEQATGDQRLPKRDGPGRCSRERALPGSAAIRRAAACSRSSSRPPRRAASATQPR